MKPALLQILVCPDCRRSLELQAPTLRDEEIFEGLLHCAACGLSYPIRQGIPRFVSDDEYVSTFSFEWKRWRRTQFDRTARSNSLKAFKASTGLEPDALAGKRVLEAGAGSGRFMDLLAQTGAEVVGIDLSFAIDVAQENLAASPNCHFVQADILQLPFADGQFDFIYSIGVLHHTPGTKAAFMSLVPALRPDGQIAIWVYPRQRLKETFEYFPDQVNEVLALDSNFQIPPGQMERVRRWAGFLDDVMRISSDCQRAVTTRLPQRLLYALCYLAVPLYYVYRIPLFFPLRLMTKIAMHPEAEWRVLDTFDWYSPRYQWKHFYGEVRSWFEQAGLADIELLPRPVALRGKKPSAGVAKSPA
jgi:SAM-dependent methyltransferase